MEKYSIKGFLGKVLSLGVGGEKVLDKEVEKNM